MSHPILQKIRGEEVLGRAHCAEPAVKPAAAFHPVVPGLEPGSSQWTSPGHGLPGLFAGTASGRIDRAAGQTDAPQSLGPTSAAATLVGPNLLPPNSGTLEVGRGGRKNKKGRKIPIDGQPALRSLRPPRLHRPQVDTVPEPKAKKTIPSASRQRFKVIPFQNHGGTQSWRVIGTNRQGKQIRENFSDENAAHCRQVELMADWLGRQPPPAPPHISRRSTAFAAGPSQEPTDEEKILGTFLKAFGKLHVRDKAAFSRDLAEWFQTNVREVK